jgi:hypothetical protein
MKALIVLIFAGMSLPAIASGSHVRKGHITKKGTYVAPNHATNPDGKRSNNYSQKGNVNPYTGKAGSK